MPGRTGNRAVRQTFSIDAALVSVLRPARLDFVPWISDIPTMKRDMVISRLRSLRDEFQAEGITALYLFGSVLRDEAGPESDVDLFFDTDNPRFNILDYVHVKDRANEILPWKIDLIERSCLHRAIRASVESEAVRIF